jgi:hypothetical protein
MAQCLCQNVVSSCCSSIKYQLDYVDALLGPILFDQELIICQHLIQILV